VSNEFTLDQHRHGFRLLNILNKGVFLLSKRVLVHQACPTKNIRCEIVYRVLRDTSTTQLQSTYLSAWCPRRLNPIDVPLHISPLRPSQRKDPILDQNIQTHRIDTLLVDQYESLWLLPTPNSLVTNGILELDNLLQLRIDKPSFGLDQFFSLFRRRIEETRVDLAIVVISLYHPQARQKAHVFSYSSETLSVRMKAFSTLFGMSGCLAPWSMTKPLTSCVSVSVLCCIFMTSIMCKSIGSR
jgi:hypothetical protein